MSIIIMASGMKEYDKKHSISTVFPASGTSMVDKIIYQAQKDPNACTGKVLVRKCLFKYKLVNIM